MIRESEFVKKLEKPENLKIETASEYVDMDFYRFRNPRTNIIRDHWWEEREMPEGLTDKEIYGDYV